MRVGAVAAALLLASGAAGACGEDLGAGAQRVGDAQIELAYRLRPAAPVVGQHFVIDIALCTRDPAAVAQALRVDAHMPAHRHGMNYRPSVNPRGPGRYRAEGLLLHMSGTWELVFEVQVGAGRARRLTQALTVD